MGLMGVETSKCSFQPITTKLRGKYPVDGEIMAIKFLGDASLLYCVSRAHEIEIRPSVRLWHRLSPNQLRGFSFKL